MKYVSRTLAAFFAAAALVLSVSPAWALLVQPVVIDLKTSGEHTSAALTITNDRNRPDTIEITVSKLTLPEKGAPVLTPDKGDNFLIFPPAFTIQPGKTQVVRIRWVGEPILNRSEIYMFSTSEIPVDKIQGSGVQLLYSIQSVVTVTSPALKPDVHVASVARDSQALPAQQGQPAQTQNGVTIVFQNDGTAIDYVSRYRITLTVPGSPEWSKTLETTDVSKAVGLGLLAPNSKRDLFFPMPDVPATGTIQASIEVAPER